MPVSLESPAELGDLSTYVAWTSSLQLERSLRAVACTSAAPMATKVHATWNVRAKAFAH
jgi:hypothetical protein